MEIALNLGVIQLCSEKDKPGGRRQQREETSDLSGSVESSQARKSSDNRTSGPEARRLADSYYALRLLSDGQPGRNLRRPYAHSHGSSQPLQCLSALGHGHLPAETRARSSFTKSDGHTVDRCYGNVLHGYMRSDPADPLDLLRAQSWRESFAAR